MGYVRRVGSYTPDENEMLKTLKAEIELKLDMKLTERQFILIKFGIDAPTFTQGRPVESTKEKEELYLDAVTSDMEPDELKVLLKNVANIKTAADREDKVES